MSQLGIQLLARTTRKASLTEPGTTLLERGDITGAATEAERLVSALAAASRGGAACGMT